MTKQHPKLNREWGKASKQEILQGSQEGIQTARAMRPLQSAQSEKVIYFWPWSNGQHRESSKMPEQLELSDSSSHLESRMEFQTPESRSSQSRTHQHPPQAPQPPRCQHLLLSTELTKGLHPAVSSGGTNALLWIPVHLGWTHKNPLC